MRFKCHQNLWSVQEQRAGFWERELYKERDMRCGPCMMVLKSTCVYTNIYFPPKSNTEGDKNRGEMWKWKVVCVRESEIVCMLYDRRIGGMIRHGPFVLLFFTATGKCCCCFFDVSRGKRGHNQWEKKKELGDVAYSSEETMHRGGRKGDDFYTISHQYPVNKSV